MRGRIWGYSQTHAAESNPAAMALRQKVALSGHQFYEWRLKEIDHILTLSCLMLRLAASA